MTRLLVRPTSLFAGLLVLSGSWLAVAHAAPHPGYRPVAVSRMTTYRQSNQVGNVAFALAFPDPQLARPDQPLSELTFSQGRPPDAWWGRSYHPCTLDEAITALPDAARAFRVATLVYLDGTRIGGTVFDLEDEHLGATWNTLSWDGSSVNAELGQLSPGRHTLTVWRYLNYRLPQRDPQTGETVWEHRTMALAKGELPITVRP